MEILNETLKRTGYEYDTLMNLLHVSVSKHILDEYYTLVWCNDYYYELIGYSREEYEALYHNKPAHYYMNDDLNIHDEKLWMQLSARVMETLESGEKSYNLVTRMWNCPLTCPRSCLLQRPTPPRPYRGLYWTAWS